MPVSVNYWPAIGAVSFGCLVLGLAVGPALFVIGIIGIVATLFEWTVRAWSDHATGDAELNRSLRGALLGPFELPIGGVLVVVGIVAGMSRILLALPKVGSIIVFGAVPAVILGIGALVALKPKLSHSAIAASDRRRGRRPAGGRHRRRRRRRARPRQRPRDRGGALGAPERRVIEVGS